VTFAFFLTNVLLINNFIYFSEDKIIIWLICIKRYEKVERFKKKCKMSSSSELAGLRKALVSPISKSSSVTLINRASSSSLMFDTRLRTLFTLSTARPQVSKNGPRIYIFLQERVQKLSSLFFPHSTILLLSKAELVWVTSKEHVAREKYQSSGGIYILSPRPVVLLWAWDFHTGV